MKRSQAFGEGMAFEGGTETFQSILTVFTGAIKGIFQGRGENAGGDRRAL